MLKQGDTITVSGMAENILNSVYTVSSANPTALTLQIQLNAGYCSKVPALYDREGKI